jgi:hypothetical protein
MKTTTYPACPCGNPEHWGADNPFGPELVRHRLAIDDHDVEGANLPSFATPGILTETSSVPRFGDHAASR